MKSILNRIRRCFQDDVHVHSMRIFMVMRQTRGKVAYRKCKTCDHYDTVLVRMKKI